jgi:hypothetical protein
VAVARQVVDPPSFTPSAYGLLSVVEWVPTNDTHWMNGITYQPLCSASLGGTTYDDCISVTGTGGPPPPESSLSNTATLTTRAATAFTVFAEFDCAPIGNAQAQRRAEQAMAQAEPWQVERAFWTGQAGGQAVAFPHLAASAQVLVDGTVILQSAAVDVSVTGTGSPAVNGDLLNPATALGLLEQALANCYGGVGVIHVPAVALPSLDSDGLVNTSGPVMRTANGNKVSVGDGYPATSPAGVARAANSAWLYATGNVFGYRSPTRVRAPQGPEAFDRSTNTMKMIADRTYVLGWDCCHFAVPMALGVPKGT